MERLGRWNEAVAQFETIAQRFPEHAVYVGNCIQAVRDKMALTGGLTTESS
jgi:hypothetical protein